MNEPLFSRHWVITDGNVGMETQCVGLAHAAGLTPHVMRLRLPIPWRWVAPFGASGHLLKSVNLSPPWPDLVIASGRHSVPIARAIGQASKGHTKLVQIQNPVAGLHTFSLVIAPAHDELAGANVLTTDGSLHACTPQKLAKASQDLALDDLTDGAAAVLIGGPNRAYAMGEDFVSQLIKDLNALDVPLLVTTSRRTPPRVAELLQKHLVVRMFWNAHDPGNVPNPYHGFLGLARWIIVTADSVNMVSEAAWTGKPVYVVQPSPRWGQVDKKFEAFHAHLNRLGITRTFRPPLTSWTYTPLEDMTRAVRALCNLIGQPIPQENLPPPPSAESPPEA